MTIVDFQNWSLHTCKENVIKYQETQSTELFHQLLARFDKYILYVIYEMRKRTPYLWNEEMQELYHTGILGFHKGIMAFKHHLDPFFLILVIKAYIKSELRQMYSYKRRECTCEHFPVIFEEEDITNELDIFALFELLGTSLEFKPRDKEVMIMRFKQNKSVEEIAKHYSLTEIAIYKSLAKIMKKLKKTFREELKRFS